MSNAIITVSDFTPAQLSTIRRTVARDANDTEFDLFLETARSYGLNPFRKQMHLIVYNKDKPEKRSIAMFPSRDGLRVIAARCGDYRPPKGPAEFVYSDDAKDELSNPLGIVSCGVYFHKQDQKTGEWFPVYGSAYWDEFAQLKQVWEGGQFTGKYKLNPTWEKMPRLMIEKCAHGQAIRNGWPEQFSGLMLEEELPDREMKDITPSQMVRDEEIHQRQNRLGHKAILMVFDDTGVLERVPIGQVADRCVEFIEQNDADAIYTWKIRNEHGLREFWAENPGDALTVKKLIEDKTANVGASND